MHFLFIFALAVAFFSISSELVMRVRLTVREIPSEKLLWWRKGGDEVASMYQEVFPGTRLPIQRSVAFYLFLAFSVVLLVGIVLRRG
jgi:hypothetical protein